MTDLPSLILAIVQRASRERPVMIREIAESLSLPYTAASTREREATRRRIARAVEELCAAGHLIVARRRPPNGYYICVTLHEYDQAVAPQRKQALTMLRKFNQVRHAARRQAREIAGQMRLGA